MISGPTKNVTKSGPSDPVFITKICQKYKKIWERPGQILNYNIWEDGVSYFFESHKSRFFGFSFVAFVWTVEYLTLSFFYENLDRDMLEIA